MDIVGILNQGGPMMWVILGLSVTATTLAAERAVSLYLLSGLNASKLVDKVKGLVESGDFDGALKACAGKTKHPLPTIMRAGLERANRPSKEIEKAMEAEMLRALPKMQRSLSFLGLLGNLATLLGLLGTIFGLIQAFSGVSAASASARQQVLAEGISVAMYTTAFGIIAAVPVLLFHNVLSSRVDKILIEMEEGSVSILAALSAFAGRARGHNRSAA